MISFDKQLRFVCKIAHWKADSKVDKILLGNFCKLLIDSLVFLFLSKVSSILGRRGYFGVYVDSSIS
jgi:hypothetical protein